MSHYSYSGQDKVSYCLECCEKHGQTAKVLLREALERANVHGANSEGVMEKVRGVVAELTGMEDDTNTTENDEVVGLHDEARDIRKEIYASRCEIGACEINRLRDLSERLDSLVNSVYDARQRYECPNCSQKAAEFGSALTHVEDIDVDSPARRRAKLLAEIRRRK